MVSASSADNPIADLIVRSGGRAEVLLHYHAATGYQLITSNLEAALLFELPEHASNQSPLKWEEIPSSLANYFSEALANASDEPAQNMPDFVIDGKIETRYSVQLHYAVKTGTDTSSDEFWYLFCFQNATPWANDFQAAVENRKLQTIGELASGVAHDFNNLIMGIQANAESLLSQQAFSDNEHNCLVNIIRACATGSSLTRSLLGYAKRQPLDMTEFDLINLVNDVSNIARLSLGTKYRIMLAESLHAGQPAISSYGCYSSLSHCLLNLVKNAREAMPDGGTIQVLWEGTADQVCLTVKDEGVGIPESDLARIFEPFFSTKKKGTGLGMAMVQGIMSQHKGRVNVVSKVGVGTSVSLIWPRPQVMQIATGSVSGGPDPRRSTVSFKEAMLNRAETLSQLAYVIDDDDLVRDGVKGLLEHLGFRVETFDESVKALQALSLRSIPKLILVDFNMPGMDGSEFIRYWFEQLPEIYRDADTQILLVSGNPPHQFQEFLEQYSNHNVGLLQKPFSLDTLSKKIANSKSPRTMTMPLPQAPRKNKEGGDVAVPSIDFKPPMLPFTNKGAS